MPQSAVCKLPLCRFDGVHHRVALWGADEIASLLRHIDLGQRFDHLTKASRVHSDRGQQPAGLDVGDDLHDFGDILQLVINDCQ
ncbi:hypothetical protein D3C80_1586560 [compost metagenome]